MDKAIFIGHFELVLAHLHDFTSQLCFNKLSRNYKFILEPSERTISSHLSEEENSYLKIWNQVKDKQLSFNQVVDLFYKNGNTPKWADCNVYYSSNNVTVVYIFFSRQFRDEREIYYLDRGTGPFKAVVAIPPDHLKVMKDDKFDLNWKKHLDDNKSSFITKLKRFFHKARLPPDSQHQHWHYAGSRKKHQRQFFIQQQFQPDGLLWNSNIKRHQPVISFALIPR